VPVALRTFGSKGKGREANCGTTLTLPLAPLDRDATLGVVRELKARKRTSTPIGAALAAIVEDLDAVSGPRTVVLVTDGKETCGGDPAAVIAAARARGLDIQVNIVGFALEDEALKETMRAWARAGGGTYFDATDAASLAGAVATAVGAPFRIVGPTGELVAGGTVGADPVAVPPGTYRVEVLVDPPAVFADVVVGSGEAVELELAPHVEEP